MMKIDFERKSVRCDNQNLATRRQHFDTIVGVNVQILLLVSKAEQFSLYL